MTQIGQDYFINLACTGAIPKKSLTPHVPVTVEEIVADAGEAIELGVQMLHVHARDAAENQTSDPALFSQIVKGIRALPGGREVIVCVSTSGRFDPSFEARSKVLDLGDEARPDMASLTLSSMNFLQSASVNTPDTIKRLAAAMKERGIRPEFEIFDLGMINFIGILLKEKLVEPPFYANILLGNVAGLQADLLELGTALARLPRDTIVGIAGLGRHQLTATTLGLLFAQGVRTGIEDNIWRDTARTKKARNADLVRQVQDQALLLDRQLVPVATLRARLGLR